MIELQALPAVAQATLIVAVVLLEAVALYVGYGVVERALGPSIVGAIRNT